MAPDQMPPFNRPGDEEEEHVPFADRPAEYRARPDVSPNIYCVKAVGAGGRNLNHIEDSGAQRPLVLLYPSDGEPVTWYEVARRVWLTQGKIADLGTKKASGHVSHWVIYRFDPDQAQLVREEVIRNPFYHRIRTTNPEAEPNPAKPPRKRQLEE
jgi:hypothetical protein